MDSQKNEMKHNFNELKSFQKLFQCHPQRMSKPPYSVKAGRILALFNLINISVVITCFNRKLLLADVFTFSDLSQMSTDFLGKFFLLLSSTCWSALIREKLWFHTYYYTESCCILHCTSIVVTDIMVMI